MTYQHLKWVVMIATPGHVLSEHDSAAEIWEGFQFTGSLGKFPFHVDVRVKLAFEKNEVLCELEHQLFGQNYITSSLWR